MMFLLAAISNCISIIAGRITEVLGWHYNFHVLVPFAAAQTIMVIVFCPETMYRRSHLYETDLQGSEENLEKLAHVEDLARHIESKQAVTTEEVELEKVVTETVLAPVPAKKTYIQELKLYNGTFVDDPIWKMVLACIAIIFVSRSPFLDTRDDRH